MKEWNTAEQRTQQLEQKARRARLVKWCAGTICILMAIYVFVLQTDPPPIKLSLELHGWSAVTLVILLCFFLRVI